MKNGNTTPNRDRVAEMGYEKSFVLEAPSFDAAIIGVDTNGRVVYDFEKMIRCLKDDRGMDRIKAIEFIETNTLRVLPYYKDGAPVVMYPLEDGTE